METQIELFPLPKKQKSLFGKAKGTVLGESPVKYRQTFSSTSEGKNDKLRSSQSEGVLKSAEIRGSNNAFKPRYHRCDPIKPTIIRERDKSESKPLIVDIDPSEYSLIEEELDDLLESEPFNDASNEPLPVTNEVTPIQILGHVAHIDPTHENPYEHNQPLWQSVRNFFKNLFRN